MHEIDIKWLMVVNCKENGWSERQFGCTTTSHSESERERK